MTDNTSYGIVCYADGGAKPNPGFGGRGIHGYVYRHDEKQVNHHAKNYLITDKGYFVKTEVKTDEFIAKYGEVTPVTPVHYIDGYGTYGYTVTNNICELTAAMDALELVNKFNANRILIISDSKYVVVGTNEYLDKWKKNDYIRQDGTTIANVELWKKFSTFLDHIREKGVIVELRWMNGHINHIGNDSADHLASVGVMKSTSGKLENQLNVSNDIKAYWNMEVERHPFVSHRRMYFNTMPEYLIEGQYYLGDHGKDDDLLGKRVSDGALAFVSIAQTDPILEMIRNHHSELAGGLDTLIMARLDAIYEPFNYRDLVNFQNYALVRSKTRPNRFDLEGLNEEPLTRELRPAMLAIRAIESLTSLASHLDGYLLSDARYSVTDITDYFFDYAAGKKKKNEDPEIVYKIKSSLDVGAASLVVEANYNVNHTPKVVPLTLTFNIDMPRRNSFKNMEALKPKVNLITWKESDQSFRYAVVITTDKDKGIWAGVYSNLVMVPE